MMQVRCGVIHLGKAELQAKIDHWDDFSTEVDHPLDIRRRLRHGRNVLNAHDFPHLRYADCELFAPQDEGQILARSRIGGSGAGFRLLYYCAWHRFPFVSLLFKVVLQRELLRSGGCLAVPQYFL